MTETWIILGATAGMAKPFLRKLAEAGHGLLLTGRRIEVLEELATDLRHRGARQVHVAILDMRAPEGFGPLIEQASTHQGTLSVAVFTGTMPPQAEIDADPSMIEGVVTDSFTGPARFLTLLAPVMESRGGGAVIGVTSVAGDRGRLGNYVYGAAKAGFATYLSGLRNRLARSGVHVMTVKPGPVDTPMTQGLGPQPLMTTPEAVAEDLMNGLRKRRNVVYTRGIWRLVMTVIRLIPEPVFKRLKI